MAAIKARIESDIAAMSAEELAELMVDVRSRLDVILLPEGEVARTWLGQYMAVVTLSKDEWQRTRPDVTKKTTQQMKEKLMQVNAKPARVARQAEEAERGRYLQAEAVRSEIQYYRAARERALDRSYCNDYGSYR